MVNKMKALLLKRYFVFANYTLLYLNYYFQQIYSIGILDLFFPQTVSLGNSNWRAELPHYPPPTQANGG